jgi:hypothetical protein
MNLVGFYKFDHSEGTQVIDYSSASTNLDTNNLPVYVNTNGILNNFDIENCWVSGIVNNSLLFDGFDDYVYIESNAQNGLNTLLEIAPQSMSISLWVNVPSTRFNSNINTIVSNTDTAISFEGSYIFGLYESAPNDLVLYSKVGIDSGYIDLSGNTKINDSTWHHIVQTIDLSSGTNCLINIYVDGVLDNSLDVVGTISVIQHNTARTYFGCMDSNNTDNFQGNMDELRFYKSILSN